MSICKMFGGKTRRGPGQLLQQGTTLRCYNGYCSIHLDPRVRRLIEGAGAVIVYSAAYSPELIPIDYIFNNWKSYMKRWHRDFTAKWLKVHVLALPSLTGYSLSLKDQISWIDCRSSSVWYMWLGIRKSHDCLCCDAIKCVIRNRLFHARFFFQ